MEKSTGFFESTIIDGDVTMQSTESKSQTTLSARLTSNATADSPVGLATMFIDHDQPSLALISRSFDGKLEGSTRDDVHDNITLFWLTNTAISSYRLYWENKLAFLSPLGVKVPVVVNAFPDELVCVPRSWAEKAYPKMIYCKKHNKGEHFAACEQPEFLVNDIREGFKSLR